MEREKNSLGLVQFDDVYFEIVIRYLKGDIKQIDGFMNLGFKRDVKVRNVNQGVNNMVFLVRFGCDGLENV